MSKERMFPVHPYSMRAERWFPRYIPWSVAEQFREQAYRNHSQTLERLAERGGLSPEEMLFASKGQSLRFGELSPEVHLEALSFVVKANSPAAPPDVEGNTADERGGK